MPIEAKEYFNRLNKTSWEAGPWNGEPDKKQWQDEATGLPCLIVRSSATGALCGYVGVPNNHPIYGQDYNEVSDQHEIDVHGGLTFAGSCQKNEDESYGICHVAPPGEDNVWWFGFDCSHFMDLAPEMEATLKSLGSYPDSLRENVYRDLDYVTGEVTALAQQLKQIEPKQLTYAGAV